MVMSTAQGEHLGEDHPHRQHHCRGWSGRPGVGLIGDRLSATWKQPVVVEGIVGAGGNLAAAHVAKAPPDGYTLLMSGDAAIVTNISLYKKLPFDPLRDLLPITQVGLTPNILTVHNDVPAKTAQELAALVRAQKGKFVYGHGGLGFSTHLAGEVFKSMAKADIQQVPYKTGRRLMTDLLTGRITMCFCNVTQVLPHVREGKLRALAISGLKRSAQRRTYRPWTKPNSAASMSRPGSR